MALRSRVPRRSRRKTVWGIGPLNTKSTTSASAAVLWSQGIGLAVQTEATIVRIRGYAAAYLTASDAVAGGFEYAVGIGVVTDAAFSVGTTALPTPLTEEDWDGWMYHRYGSVRSITATIADGVNSATVVDRWEIDSKAMRKLTPEMTMFGIIQYTETVNASVQFEARTRILLKLP